MFPRSFLFFVFIMAIDLILKSAKDKKKIERSRRRLNKNNSSKYYREKTKPIVKEEVKKPIQKKERPHLKSLEKTPWEEPLFTETEEYIKNEDKKTYEFKKDIKNDILRGVIFSEILSKPKSMRKSI